MNASEKNLKIYQKRKGTKKAYKAAMQKGRCRSFLNQKLGTVSHKSEKDYDRHREKEFLRKEVSNPDSVL